jgi:hypothetical protein
MGCSRNILLALCCILFLFTSCSGKHHNAVRGIYYWKTVYKPGQFELATLRHLGARKIYLRLFDVDEDEHLKQPVPVAPVRIQAADTGFTYVPVIFITQKALIALNDTAADDLATHISAMAAGICAAAGIRPAEVQIDCDWTSGTKNKYFALLKAVKRQPFMKGITLSCTIRLNQVKYQVSCGIPPADRGMVMAYSMGNLKKPGAHNSILDAGDAEDYLKYLKSYPLQLDIALPIFEWCVLFRRQQFAGILHDVTTNQVITSGLFRHKEGNLYTCLQDSAWHGYKLGANDIIRVEAPSYSDILSVADYSSRLIKNTDLSIVLFSCDSITLSKFPDNELETIYNSYH